MFEASIAPGGGIDKNYPPKAESPRGEALHLILLYSPGVPARNLRPADAELRVSPLRATYFLCEQKVGKESLREKTRIRLRMQRAHSRS